MKKISLKSLNLKEVEKLSREQLKHVMGGTSGSGGGSGSRWVMCCPEGIGAGVSCSTCVEVKPGNTASCSIGYLVAC